MGGKVLLFRQTSSGEEYKGGGGRGWFKYDYGVHPGRYFIGFTLEVFTYSVRLACVAWNYIKILDWKNSRF